MEPSIRPKRSSSQALISSATTGPECLTARECERSDHGPCAQASAITWFVVQSRLGELTPYAVRHTVQPLAALPGPGLVAELRAVVDMMSGDIARADLAGLWRPFAAIEAGTAAGGPLTRVPSRVPFRSIVKRQSISLF